MILAAIGILVGLVLLIWSADQFVNGSAATARHFGMPPLLIGMVIVGFGTSAPEMVVSVLASAGGNPGLAIGNAYGSNITNIALILGLTALISPIAVQSGVLRKELPILTVITIISAFLIADFTISRFDALVLLILFAGLVAWSLLQGVSKKADPLALEVDEKLVVKSEPLRTSLLRLVVGLLILIASSRLLVWGAVAVATEFGISDLIIGLTIVAVGTSLPELASSIIAARRKEHEIALGNILGSNLFNTLAVVGLAGVINPMTVGAEVLYRDVAVMTVLTVSLFALGYGFRRPGRINRWEGLALMIVYVLYTALLVGTAWG